MRLSDCGQMLRPYTIGGDQRRTAAILRLALHVSLGGLYWQASGAEGRAIGEPHVNEPHI